MPKSHGPFATLGRWAIVLVMLAVPATPCGAQAVNSSSMAGQASNVLNTGDTAWVLASTAWVLLMTIPGIALFYGGLVRQRNVLSVLMQCLALTAVLSLVWILCGYSLAYGKEGMESGRLGLHAFIGSFHHCFLLGIESYTLRGSIPELAFVGFKMTSAIIAPALMIGATVERMKFSAVLWFSTLWMLLVYVPICHMTWAGPGALFWDWGVLDFSGGIVIHISAGISALVACVMVGPRAGFPNALVPPHNMTMAYTGIALLWAGWFGFNGGSALAANGTAASALLVTHVAACMATVTWMAIDWFKMGRPGVLGAATGAIAGMAAITPASGYVGPIGGLCIGAVAAACCFLFATVVKRRFGYDDTLDVFGVHGVGGIVGTVLCGIFAAESFGGSRPDGAITRQVGVQALAALMTVIYSGVVTMLILKALQYAFGLRVTGHVEQHGLDLSEHEERGYSYT